MHIFLLACHFIIIFGWSIVQVNALNRFETVQIFCVHQKHGRLGVFHLFSFCRMLHNHGPLRIYRLLILIVMIVVCSCLVMILLIRWLLVEGICCGLIFEIILRLLGVLGVFLLFGTKIDYIVRDDTCVAHFSLRRKIVSRRLLPIGGSFLMS